MTPDELTPNTAPLVAHALGIGAGAYDVGSRLHRLARGAVRRRRPDRDRPRRRRRS